MPQRQYSELANLLALGDWGQVHDDPRWRSGVSQEDIRTATLIDIMRSLRTIANVVKCPNMQGMAIAAQSIDQLLKAELRKRTKRRSESAKKRRRTPEPHS